MRRVFRINADDDKVKVKINVQIEVKPIYSPDAIYKKVEYLKEDIIECLRNGNGHKFWLREIKFNYK